ncbi:MAG: flagellin [Verrucomicrobia bacterium]|nr:flagellin [Verrucomicrobiota bacterium]
MRVTFNTFPDTLLGRLQSLGGEQNKALTQLSTGQRISAPSDDAPAMQRILNLRTEKKQNQQYYRNATDGLEISKVTFSSLDQIKDLVVRSSELAAGVSGATSEQEYKAKASEINQLIEQGINVANTKLRGNYLFAGNSNSTMPFVEARTGGQITSVTYSGSNSESKIHVGEGESASIVVGSSADENKAIADTLKSLIALRDAMQATSSATKAQGVMSLRSNNTTSNTLPKPLDKIEDTILSALSRAGTIQYRLETVQKDLELRYESSEKLISTDADVDFAEATVRLNRSQMAYQAAIQSGAKIQNNSLLDYLR